MKKILFVCTGNICRSPTADAFFLHAIHEAGLEKAFSCDSAGTHNYHVGENPHSRTVAAARKRGVDMSTLVARKVQASDYDEFDVILAMDGGHLRALERGKPAGNKAEVALYLPYCGISHTQDVPDPYYEGPQAFEHVLDLVEEATAKLLAKLQQR